MRHLMVMFMTGLFLVPAASNAADQPEWDDHWEDFQMAMENLRQIERRNQETPQEAIQDVAEEAAREVGAMRLERGGAFVAFYHGRLLGLAGRTEQAVEVWTELAGVETVAPEAAWAITNLLRTRGFGDGVGDLAQHLSRTPTRMMGALLPLSVYGRARDWQDMPTHGTGGPRISIPSLSNVWLLQVAEALEEMRMPERSAVVYRELIYYTLDPPSVASARVEPRSWLSPQVAAYWLKAAKQEWLAGRAEEAAVHLAKAWVFADREVHEAAVAQLEVWRRDGLPDEPPQAQPDAKRIQTVVSRYREMNLYPRAFELLAEHGHVLGEPAAGTLRAELEEEWLSRTARYCVRPGSPRCVLWGQDITEERSRLEMIVPPPASEEARAEAAAWSNETLTLFRRQRADE